MERTTLPKLTIRVDGSRVSASTEFSYAGAHQPTLSTALPSLGIELQSCYLGHPGAGESIASHLQLGPDLSPQTWVELHDAHELPVSAARRRCLYDHVLQLQELLGGVSGAQVSVEVADDALERVDVA